MSVNKAVLSPSAGTAIPPGENLGKLGIKKRNEYTKIISFPSKWFLSQGNEYMVEITTQAWLKGQRYTVKEPAYVSNGKYHQR